MRGTPRQEEAGFTMIVAILIIVMVSMVVGVLMQSASGQRGETTRSVDRATQLALTDSGASRYLTALNQGFVDERTNFQLTESVFDNPSSPLYQLIHPASGAATMRKYSYVQGQTSFTVDPTVGCQSGLPGTNTRAIPKPDVVRREGAAGAAWPVDDSFAALGSRTRVILEEVKPGFPCTFWEVYRVDPLPMASFTSVGLSNRRNVNVILRGWTDGPDNKVDPRYVRASFTLPVFSDFQVLSDDHIEFGTGVQILGKVHSNNYDENTNGINGPNGGVTCQGANADVSTRSGQIHLVGSGCSTAGEAGGTSVDLGAIEKLVAKLQGAAGRCAQMPARFRCFADNGSAGYKVQLGVGAARTQITVTNLANSGVTNIETNGVPFTLLLEGGTVNVAGANTAASMPAESVTVIAHSSDVSDIHIVSGNGAFGPAAGTPGPVIGLIAQGDVFVDHMNGCGGSDMSINAAIMSETGSLTVPAKWKSQVMQPGTPTCGTLTVAGSIATREAPNLQLTWSNGAVKRGYANRKLLWNQNLSNIVPPSYPATGAWTLATWREANHDCIDIAYPHPANKPSCTL